MLTHVVLDQRGGPAAIEFLGAFVATPGHVRVLIDLALLSQQASGALKVVLPPVGLVGAMSALLVVLSWPFFAAAQERSMSLLGLLSLAGLAGGLAPLADDSSEGSDPTLWSAQSPQGDVTVRFSSTPATLVR